jgi:hypothetical protein
MSLRSLSRLIAAFTALLAGTASAVPTFARQTGLSCSQCHTIFPELTPFGRQFKAGGYTFTTTKQITESVGPEDSPRPVVELPANVPLGVQTVIGYTHTDRAQQVAPNGPPAKNDDIAFPQQFSLFFGGKIAPKLGAFIQLTYEGPGDHLGLDNSDIRFAHTFQLSEEKTLVVGATVNNSPTVSDLWNSTPAWGVPFTASASAPTPAAGTLIEGALAQSVIGGGLYAYYNNLIYAEFDVYRSAPLGVTLPLDSSTGATAVIDTVMPYWRLAFEKVLGNHSISVGTFGLTGALLPGGTVTDTSTDPPTVTARPLTRPGDHYTDIALDAQYQYIGTRHIITAVATYIHETRFLEATNAFGGSDNLLNELHSVKLSGSYIWDRHIGTRVTFAAMRGSSDSTLYGGQGPSATALHGELFFTPWYNVKLGLMYTAYLDFNGAAINYDGNGRNAAANNTTYAYLWLGF